MSAYDLTTLSIAVSPVKLPEGESPVFAAASTIVSVTDEGAGPFIEIQNVEDGSTIKLDPDELDPVFMAAKHLLDQKALKPEG